MAQDPTERIDGDSDPDSVSSDQWAEFVIETLRKHRNTLRIEELVAPTLDPDTPAPVLEDTTAYERLVADVLPELVRNGWITYSHEDRTVTLVEGKQSTPQLGLRRGVGIGLVVLVSVVFQVGLIDVVGLGVGLGVAAVATTGARVIGNRPSESASPDVPSVLRIDEPDSRDLECRVLELLLANGGMMEQCDVVDDMECSKSTVSRHLSRLQDDGLVRKLPTGRRNVVFLRGVAPADAPESTQT